MASLFRPSPLAHLSLFVSGFGDTRETGSTIAWERTRQLSRKSPFITRDERACLQHDVCRFAQQMRIA